MLSCTISNFDDWATVYGLIDKEYSWNDETTAVAKQLVAYIKANCQVPAIYYITYKGIRLINLDVAIGHQNITDPVPRELITITEDNLRKPCPIPFPKTSLFILGGTLCVALYYFVKK